MAKTPEQIAARAAQLARQERDRQDAERREAAGRLERLRREDEERTRRVRIGRATKDCPLCQVTGTDPESDHADLPWVMDNNGNVSRPSTPDIYGG